MWFKPDDGENTPVEDFLAEQSIHRVVFPWSEHSSFKTQFFDFVKWMPPFDDTLAVSSIADVQTAWKESFPMDMPPGFSALQECHRQDSALVDRAFGFACSLLRKSQEWLPGVVSTLPSSPVCNEATLHRRQIALLLAHSFVGTSRFFCNDSGKDYNDFSCTFVNAPATNKIAVQKTFCLLHYFDEIRSIGDRLDGAVTFLRVVQNERHTWGSDTRRLSDVQFERNRKIEDTNAEECVQTDFANKFIGGGVMRSGAVQEEIHFVTYPECLASLLVCARMRDTDAIHIIGARRFTDYTGYASTFRCHRKTANDPRQTISVDVKGRAKIDVVAFDASPFRSALKLEQFELKYVNRDLHKAYVAFKKLEDGDSRSIATGNWGCGAFGGNVCLKFIIQLLAASAAGRNMVYCSFNSPFHDDLARFYSFCRKMDTTIGELYRSIEALSISSIAKVGERDTKTNVPLVFHHIKTAIIAMRARSTESRLNDRSTNP